MIQGARAPVWGLRLGTPVAAGSAVFAVLAVWRMAEQLDADFIQLVSIEGAVHVSAVAVCLAGWGSAMAAWGRRTGPLGAVITAGGLTALTWVAPVGAA